MAGHSKWSNIEHRKNRQDKIRSAIFSRCARDIIVATKQGGSDPKGNARLRLAIEKARAANMTRDKIERAINKGLGGADTVALEEIRYEGYGPYGVAVMVVCVSDNKNRSAGVIRHAFVKSGGKLGSKGLVAYLFNHRGIITFAKAVDEESIMELALLAGACDVIDNGDGSIQVLTLPQDFITVKQQLATKLPPPQTATVTMIPTTTVELDLNQSKMLLNFLASLEKLEEVQSVYHNGIIV